MRVPLEDQRGLRPRLSFRRIVRGKLPLLIGLLLSATLAHAQRLPIKNYTTADGLSNTYVQRMTLDSHGFLWFCTRDGLSRFDGYSFKNYNMRDGLPNSTVNYLLESRTGVYWVATNGGGVSRFNPSYSASGGAGSGGAGEDEALFKTYTVGDSVQTNRVNTLFEDRRGRLWAGTDYGLFYLDQTDQNASFKHFPLILSPGDSQDMTIGPIVEDEKQALWIASVSGLIRLGADGEVKAYTTGNGLPINYVRALLRDREGSLWAGTTEGLCLIAANPESREQIVARVYTTKDGLTDNWIHAIYQSPDDRLWVGTLGGVSEFNDGQVRTYTHAHGLGESEIGDIVEDTAHNLWIAYAGNGATKISFKGFSSYGKADGAGLVQVRSIFESPAGGLLFVSRDEYVTRFDKGRVTSVRFDLPEAISTGWVSNVALLDHAGEWWVATDEGLYRFPAVRRVEDLAHTKPKAVYTKRDGLPRNEVARIFEDSAGNIWLGVSETQQGLFRWNRATGTFQHFTNADGLPANNTPSAFCEDHDGTLWIGLYEGGIARYRQGRFETFTTADGFPAGMISALFLDHAGRLWIASTHTGLSRIDDPSAEHPQVVTYTMAEGLATNDTRSLTEDSQGRIYAGSVHGVDRLDPATGHVKHYTMADGLSNDFVASAFRDREGVLWFGTMNGISKLTPQADDVEEPAPVLIGGLRVAGVPQRISELGETSVGTLTLETGQLEIDFTSLSFAPGETRRFQYRIEGVDRDWSAPTEQRAVNYGGLSPGSYRFLVRAVNSDGVVSRQAASVTFTVLAPVWRRWWFVLLALLLLVAAVYSVYRYRLTRLLEMERVRARIAADLHDDIGSSLSQISILSEVLRKQLDEDETRVDRTLSLMRRVSHEALDSMSDIVWAINPQHDRLDDLVRRARRFASELLPARDIEFTFIAPRDGHGLKLDADLRRQAFLVFKESLNNAVRHSGCTRVEIEFRLEGPALILRVADNGKGFVESGNGDGQGLRSMRRRAHSLGGDLSLSSRPSDGTRVVLKVPRARQPRVRESFDAGSKRNGNGAGG